MATSSFPVDGAARGPQVGVIGSARLGQDSPEWAVGESVGAALAAAGFTVVTGGYGGLMAAASKGAAGAGGYVVGLPMRSWRHLRPNEWNHELRWADGYPARLASFLACQAVVAVDGGAGTLAELAVLWAAAQTEPGAARLVVLGERWRRMVGAFAEHLVVDASDLALIDVVRSPAEALAAVRAVRAGAGSPRPAG